MKLVLSKGRYDMVTAHRICGFSLGRKHGWQYGLLLSEDRSTLFLGWFRSEAYVHLDDNDDESPT